MFAYCVVPEYYFFLYRGESCNHHMLQMFAAMPDMANAYRNNYFIESEPATYHNNNNNNHAAAATDGGRWFCPAAVQLAMLG